MIYIHLFVFLAYLPWVELLRLLNRNDESGHHFLVPDLREEAFRLLFFFLPLIMMSVVVFSYFFIMLRQFPSILSLFCVLS